MSHDTPARPAAPSPDLDAVLDRHLRGRRPGRTLAARAGGEPVLARAARRWAFLVSALVVAPVAIGVLAAAWAVVAAFAITPASPLALTVLAATVVAAGWVEAALARGLVDAPVRGPRRPRAKGYWRGARAVLRAGDLWRAQAYVLVRLLLGVPLAGLVLGVTVAGGAGVAAPLVYRWIPQDGGGHGYDLGVRHVDTFGEALLLVPVGLVLLALVIAATEPLGRGWRRIATALLPARMADVSDPTLRPAARLVPPSRTPVLAHALATAAVSVVLTVIWLSATRGTFWPFWPIEALAAVLAVHAWVWHLRTHRELWRRPRMTFALAVHGGVAAIVWLYLVGIWAVTSPGVFWPGWPLLGLGLVVGVHWLVVVARRIDHLEAQRAGAVAVQETDLRRIERDLHDGAQARLVSLGMSLGLAEQRFDADPDGARQLVREARTGVTEALGELRSLVRGIRPPVLADRGLDAAIGALVDASPLPIDVRVSVDPRPSDEIETAAYFVVAECLANTGKHAGATRASVRVERWNDRLRVEVVDDGRGGADPHGAGLLGLRRRVEAVGGTLRVESPPGGPTEIRAELPCAS